MSKPQKGEVSPTGAFHCCRQGHRRDLQTAQLLGTVGKLRCSHRHAYDPATPAFEGLPPTCTPPPPLLPLPHACASCARAAARSFKKSGWRSGCSPSAAAKWPWPMRCTRRPGTARRPCSRPPPPRRCAPRGGWPWAGVVGRVQAGPGGGRGRLHRVPLRRHAVHSGRAHRRRTGHAGGACARVGMAPSARGCGGTREGASGGQVRCSCSKGCALRCRVCITA